MSISLQELNARLSDETIFVNDLLAEINKVIVGQPTLIERVLTALLADGHLLLEGVPGLAKTLLIKTTAESIHANFARIQFTPDLLPADLIGRVQGHMILSLTADGLTSAADLGLSSDQLADGGRGFAFALDGPLDMRFDPAADVPTAADLVNGWPEKRLADAIFEYGEERHARAIARAIVNARGRGPLATTCELAAVVARAVGGARGRIHPATRTFQALRVVVNDELAALTAALSAAVSIMAVGGAVVVIAYHSLEDRAVKLFFREGGRAGTLTVLTPKPLRPAAQEVRANPRGRSAHLRAAIRN